MCPSARPKSPAIRALQRREEVDRKPDAVARAHAYDKNLTPAIKQMDSIQAKSAKRDGTAVAVAAIRTPRGSVGLHGFCPWFVGPRACAPA